MQLLSLVWGILAIVGMIVGFIPCLGALNWLNIPFAAIGGVAVGTAGNEPKGSAVAGLVLCVVAMLFGIIRLVLGGGVL